MNVRAYEFITESRVGSIQPDVVSALPATYTITSLSNNDAYLQYRFGVAIAGAKGRKKREEDNVPLYAKESPWGHNEVIVSFDPNIEEWLTDAMSQMGITGLKRLSTLKSQESQDVDKVSPIKGFKGYGK